MNWDRLVCVEAPTAAPLSLVAAKAHLRVDHDDDDATIEAAIAAAVATIDGPRGIGFAMMAQTWRLSLDGFTCDVADPKRPQAIRIPLGPVSEISSLKYIDGAGDLVTLDAAAYELHADEDPAVVVPVWSSTWPLARRQPGAVKIEFVAGLGEAVEGGEATGVPADLIQALKLLVGHFHENRSAVIALASGSVVKLPMAVESILDRYRVTGIA